MTRKGDFSKDKWKKEEEKQLKYLKNITQFPLQPHHIKRTKPPPLDISGDLEPLPKSNKPKKKLEAKPSEKKSSEYSFESDYSEEEPKAESKADNKDKKTPEAKEVKSSDAEQKSDEESYGLSDDD